jgi:hypothetical protein
MFIGGIVLFVAILGIRLLVVVDDEYSSSASILQLSNMLERIDGSLNTAEQQTVNSISKEATSSTASTTTSDHATTAASSSSSVFQSEWTPRHPPTDCPESMMATTTTMPIIQSDKYAHRVGMVTIAMKRGKAFQRQALDLVQSIRRRGAWLGPIILIVDEKVDEDSFRQKLRNEEEVYGNFQKNTTNNTTIHVVRIHSDSDVIPLHRPYMKYKRFKTQLFDLLPIALQQLEYLVYLDVDIVIGEPIVDFLDRALPLLPSPSSDSSSSSSSSSSVNNINNNNAWLFFQEQGGHPAKTKANSKQWTLFHGGVFVIHREKSRACLHEWQIRFDVDTFPNDQTALLDLLYENKHNHDCTVGELPSEHLMMPTKGTVTNGETRTFIHFTHPRLKSVGKHVVDYKRCTLLLDSSVTR